MASILDNSFKGFIFALDFYAICSTMRVFFLLAFPLSSIIFRNLEREVIIKKFFFGKPGTETCS